MKQMKKTTKKKISEAFFSVGERSLNKSIKKIENTLLTYPQVIDEIKNNVKQLSLDTNRNIEKNNTKSNKTIESLKFILANENLSLRDKIDELSKEYVLKIKNVVDGVDIFKEYTETEIGNIKKDIENLYWDKKVSVNNVSSTLKVYSGSTYISGNVSSMTFTGGASASKNPDGSVTVNVTSGVATFYTETPSGLINGTNKTYTVLHTINTSIVLAINGQFLHPTSDYTTSGSTITMVNALPASLSGTPFTIIYT